MNKIQKRIVDKASQARLPVMCTFELLPVCNLACKMCYVRKSMDYVRENGGLKDADWWLDLAREGKKQGLLYPLITGGEPFLHPEFQRILAGLIEMGMQVSINTNGTMIDRKCAEFLSKYRPLRINMTLYGASSETYRRLCGNAAAYDRVLQAVQLLKEYDIPLKFNCSITPDNVADLPAMIAFAKEQDLPIQVATYMFPPLRRDEHQVGQNARLSPEEAALARVISDHLLSEPGWFVGQAMRYQHFVPLDQEPWKMGNGAEEPMFCRAGICSLWVDWQGNFTNCGMYPSAKAELQGSTFAESWKRIVDDTAAVRYHADCFSCPNRFLCHPCIAMIYNECGSHSGRPEYLCRMNQALAKYYDQFTREYYPDVAPVPVIAQNPADTCEL